MVKKTTSFLAIAALTCALATGAGLAPSSARAAEEPASPVSISGGVDFPTAYFFRGYLQQEDGTIAQPYGTLTWEMYKGKDLTITPWVGAWGSFHQKEGAGTNHFYEVDVLAGVDFGMGPVTVTPAYTLYHSPADAFSDIHEVEIKFGYDDSDLAKRIGSPLPLNPYIKFATEVRDRAGTEDSYMEAGLRPSFDVNVGTIPVTFGIPVTVGMSLDDYYFKQNGKEATVGYYSVAGTASIPLSVPKEIGSWSLGLRLEYLYLDAANLRALNEGDSSQVIGMVGLAVSF